MNKINILVTGCGGDIGQSIGKILRDYPRAGVLIGADLSDEHPSKFIYPRSLVLPRCDAPEYLASLEKIIRDNDIQLVIPVAEAELRFFFEAKMREVAGVPLIMANHLALETGLDKYKTYQFLKQYGLPYPETSLVSDVNDFRLPCILKSRSGAGGKDLHIIYAKKDFDYYKSKHPGFIFQELILPNDEEYTCGVFRTKDGRTKNVTIRRRLTGGFTSSGTVVNNADIEALLTTMAEKLNLVGSINVQLRLAAKGPCVFEINPRFSSTVLFRHMLGFHDLLWSLEDQLDLNPDLSTPVMEGKKIYKGYQEYIE